MLQVERMGPTAVTSNTNTNGVTVSSSNSTASEPLRSSFAGGSGKIPPPRPPPPVFTRHGEASSAPTMTMATDLAALSRSGTPPSLPSNSPPPLSEENLDFTIADDAASVSGMTDVVEIHDKVNLSLCLS